MAIITHNIKKSASDHLTSLTYNDHSRILSVTFDHERTDGPQVYSHHVPLPVFNRFLQWCKDGHSPGEYYHRFVKRFPRVNA